MPLTLKQHAYKLIRRRLVTGSIAPGCKLSDDALAKELGISRSPVREAISQLTSEGLVEYRPRCGMFVRLPQPRELEEWYETRAALEGFAIRRAADLITDVQMAELQNLADQMFAIAKACREMPGQILDEARRERFLALDLAFHMLILNASGNSWMVRLVEDYKLMTTVFGHVQIDHDLSLLSWTHAGHTRIVRTLRRRNAEACRRAMEGHIAMAQRAVLAGYETRRSALETAARQSA